MRGSNKSVDTADLRKQIKEARSKIEAVKEKLPSQSDVQRLDGLQKDADYLKLGVYGLGAGLLIVLAAGWQLYLHVDEKIDHELNYLNLRIDGLFTQKDLLMLTHHDHELKPSDHPAPSQTPLMAPNPQ